MSSPGKVIFREKRFGSLPGAERRIYIYLAVKHIQSELSAVKLFAPRYSREVEQYSRRPSTFGETNVNHNDIA